ncbi:FAD/NAD-P-binding domain-containing protein [Sparassis latifolia]
MSPMRFRVAICGGGIGGLSLAVALSKYPDIQVDVYEAAGRFREIGAGVMIWSRTWRILELLGMTSDFSKIAHAPPDGSLGIGFDYRKSDQPEEGSRFHLFALPYGCIRFHRAHFLDALVDRLPNGVAHFGKRLRSYSHGSSQDSVVLHFADDSSAECDLLVGCDGIKSVVRQKVLEEISLPPHFAAVGLNEPVWTGTIAYRGLIPVDRLVQKDGSGHRTVETPMMYCGKNKHVVSYSITGGSIVNVVAMKSEPENEVLELLRCVEKPTRWAIHQLRPLPAYVTEKVALLGDAAHAMAPHQGAGAGQAVEDAYVLAELLGHQSTTLSTLPFTLKAYQHVRLPLANRVLTSSSESGRMYEFWGTFGDDLQRVGRMIERQWDWLTETTPEGEAQRAVVWMEEAIKAKSLSRK